jgi:hypothetical protein
MSLAVLMCRICVRQSEALREQFPALLSQHIYSSRSWDHNCTSHVRHMYASKKANSNAYSFVPSNITTLTCQAIYALESAGNHNGSNESHMTSHTLLILSCNLKINIIIYRTRGNVARSQGIMGFSLLLLHIKTGSDLCVIFVLG